MNNIIEEIKFFTLNIFFIITDFFDNQFELYHNNQSSYIYSFFISFFVIGVWLCITYEINHPDVVNFYKNKFFNFKIEIETLENKLNDIKNILYDKNSFIKDNKKLNDYVDSIEHELEDINEISNLRNFTKFKNIIEERLEKADSIYDWLEEEINSSKLQKKKEFFENLKFEYEFINYSNPLYFREDAHAEIINIVIINLYNFFYILLFYIILLLVALLISIIFFDNWEEIWIKFFWLLINTFIKIVINLTILILIILIFWFFFTTSVDNISPVYQDLNEIILNLSVEDNQKILNESVLIEPSYSYISRPEFVWRNQNNKY